MMNSSQNQISDQPQHIVCFVALPFKDNSSFQYETVLLPALRKVLELDPYWWQVVRADEKYFEDIIQGNVGNWMKRVHAYVADISDLNPNVMMELGYMLWARKPDQPLLVLKRSDVTHHLADLGGFITVSYPLVNANDHYAIRRVADELRVEFAKHEATQRLNRGKQAHYLSPLFFREFQLSNEVAEKLSQNFVTMEAVATMDEGIFRSQATACGLLPLFADAMRSAITDWCKKLG